eukprot:GHVL01031682.1.p1 GENE.GHVL01031682.1~~GHVL01031682.1.p1  ORF type:complete len:495 (+),score=180.59 GHVL01031682.1:303-1787(+)
MFLIRKIKNKLKRQPDTIINTSATVSSKTDDENFIKNFLLSPLWLSPILDFVDENCLVFDRDDENKFEYTAIHMEFQNRVEELFTVNLLESGVNPTIIEKIVSKPIKRQLNQQLRAVDDFIVFKSMMVERNEKLTDEAIKSLNEMREKEGKILLDMRPQGETVEERLILRSESDLKAAIALSLQEDPHGFSPPSADEPRGGLSSPSADEPGGGLSLPSVDEPRGGLSSLPVDEPRGGSSSPSVDDSLGFSSPPADETLGGESKTNAENENNMWVENESVRSKTGKGERKETQENRHETLESKNGILRESERTDVINEALGESKTENNILLRKDCNMEGENHFSTSPVEPHGVEAPGDEANAVEAPGDEANAVEAQGGEANAVEAKGGEANAVEAQGGEANAVEAEGGEANAVEAQGGEANAVEAPGDEAKGVEAPRGEAKGVEAQGGEGRGCKKSPQIWCETTLTDLIEPQIDNYTDISLDCQTVIYKYVISYI